jgi:hypothetical protein
MDEAWDAVAKQLPEGATLGVSKKYPGDNPTHEAWAKVGINSLGFGYGKSPTEALMNLHAHLTKNAAKGL